MTASNPHEVHLSIAETGKLFALKGQHNEALRHYREALRLAVSSKAPEVFFRHYTQCVLESLELTDAYAELIQFCTDADAHYLSLNLSSSLHNRDHASVIERLGLVLLKSGKKDAARRTLQRARDLAEDGVLPVTDEVLGWLERGFTVDTARILQSQRRHHYFVVRKDQVDRKRARPFSSVQQRPVPIPNNNLTGDSLSKSIRRRA